MANDTTGAVLDLFNLSVGYGGKPMCGPIMALVDAGEILGVVGFNAAGKSTARTVASKQPMVDGEVRVCGLPVNEDAIPYRRSEAALSDKDAFSHFLSLREHLQPVVRGHSVPDPDAVPASVCSGQRRRLVPASALIRPSSLLILNERLADRIAVADAGWVFGRVLGPSPHTPMPRPLHARRLTHGLTSN